jgi:hypothetical protein
MRQSKRLVLLMVLVLLSTFAIAQQVSFPMPLAGETLCHSPVTITVTVFLNKSSVVIPHAVVLLRPILGKPSQSELRTDANGQAKASVPCGYLDMFATGFSFAPSAKRVQIEKNEQFVAISLDPSPLSLTQY